MKKFILTLSYVLGLCLMAPTMSSCSNENLNEILAALQIGYREDHGECVSRIEAFQKESGEIRCLGFSCHDTPEFLDRVLEENPYFEFVQLHYAFTLYAQRAL